MSKEKANERINSKAVQTDGRKSHTGLIIIVALVVICALIGVILYMATGKEADDELGYNQIVTPDNVDEIISQMSEENRTPIGSYNVTMNPDWVFESGDAVSSNAFVSNSVSNQNTVYFTIALNDNGVEGDVIHRSPYIPVGSSLNEIKLDTVLAKGTYDAIITYHLVDDESNEVGAVSLFMTITIDN